MTIRRSTLAASLAASLAFAANAMAAVSHATEASRLATQYSAWAGGTSNAESLVAGLRNGAPITIVTNRGAGRVSIAGFTPTASMSYGGVDSALSSARHSLARMGITHPTAEQIQAALIGGEVVTASGGTTVLKGAVVAKGDTSGRVASR